MIKIYNSSDETPIQEFDQEFNVLLVGFGESSYGDDLRPFSP